jgi:hypothetical protein
MVTTKMTRRKQTILFSLLTVVAVGSLGLLGKVLLAQTPAAESDPVSSAPRHDAWRIEPRALPPPSIDREQNELLDQRGSYFDSMLGRSGVPLDQPQPPRNGGSSGSYGVEDEIPFFPKQNAGRETIVVAKFDSYQPYLTPSHLSIYTDIKLSVEQVLAPGSSGVAPGNTIEVLLDGGTVKLPDGKTITSRIYNDSGNYSLEPGHRYLLILSYEDKGNFFTNYKDWELANGVAVPNRQDEAVRFQEGRSKYSGLTEDAFISAVRQAIQKHQQGN